MKISVLSSSFIALLLICTATFGSAGIMNPDLPGNDEDEKEKIRKHLMDWEEAWNNNDPELFAGFFTEDAHVVFPDETERNGRAEIIRAFKGLVARPLPEGVKREIQINPLSVRMLTGDVAVAEYEYQVTGVPVAPTMTLYGRATVTLVKSGDKWLRAEQINWAPTSIECVRLCREAASGSAGQAQRNKEIARKAFEVVGAGDYDKMGLYIADNYVRHCQATPHVKVRSLDAFKEYIRQDRLAIPDQQLEVKQLVAEGDKVAFWATYKGTQTGQMGPFPPSGKSLELDFAGVHRIEDGKIAESWVIWDNIAALTQLGHFPPLAEAVKD